MLKPSKPYQNADSKSAFVRARPPCGGWMQILFWKIFISRAAVAHDYSKRNLFSFSVKLVAGFADFWQDVKC